LRRLRAAVALPLLAVAIGAQAPEEPVDPGYRVTGSQVVVEGAEQWAAWEAPEGAAVVDEDGSVSPRLLRQRTNVTLNAERFFFYDGDQDTIYGGVRNTRSGAETAALAIDGDLTTYWEPDQTTPVDDWVLEVYLGRSVVVEQVIVRFAAEGEGDPFLKFRVRLSDGSDFIHRTSVLEYFRAGQVNVANKEQREFVFDVRPQRPVPDGVAGEVVQFVRIEALATDGPRGREVDAEAYAALPSGEQGAIDYFRRTVTGRVLPVDELTWIELSDEERGPVHYFRWERPRLAEIEVVSPGENIVLLTQERVNREQGVLGNVLRALTTDGNVGSESLIKPYDQLRDRNQLDIDLGAKYWLDRIRMVALHKPMRAYQVLVSDGSFDPSGERLWNEFEERANRERYLQLQESFPLQEVRYIQVRALQLLGTETEAGTLAELQAYGEGFVSEIELTSPVIKLGASRMFTSLSWEGEVPNDTRIEIRTRTGDDLTIVRNYFDRWGREMSQEAWEAAREEFRGRVEVLELPGPRWSSYSELYRESGEMFRSPSPRRYALVNVRLRTTNPQRRALIRRLQIGLAPPLVDQTFAEIVPSREVEPGVDTEFTMYLRPQFAVGDPGFDGIGLRSSSTAPVELLGLRVGSETQLRFGTGQDLLGESRIESVDGGVDIILPETERSSGRVYEMRFRTQVFLSGTTFQALLSLDSRPGVVQQASDGDAVGFAQSQTLVALSQLRPGRLLDDLQIEPPVLTPNGDGINDHTIIGLDVFQVRGSNARIDVEVFDLAGARVRDLSQTAPSPSGRHQIRWDGRDEGGRLVAPGIYIVRAGINVDASTSAYRTGLVHVAY
jgi:hypothetical protein